MGTYAPISIATADIVQKLHEESLQKTDDGMREKGYPFHGLLFTGFMITKDGPKVLEYKVRFGDPETQSLMLLMESDLAEVMVTCAEGRLVDVDLNVSNKSVATVVVAARGYPGDYKEGTPMTLGHLPQDVVLFHAGTKVEEGSGRLKTAGGRFIAASAVVDTLENAVKKAYEGVAALQFDGMQFRRDIAGRALKK